MFLFSLLVLCSAGLGMRHLYYLLNRPVLSEILDKHECSRTLRPFCKQTIVYRSLYSLTTRSIVCSKIKIYYISYCKEWFQITIINHNLSKFRNMLRMYFYTNKLPVGNQYSSLQRSTRIIILLHYETPNFMLKSM